MVVPLIRVPLDHNILTINKRQQAYVRHLRHTWDRCGMHTESAANKCRRWLRSVVFVSLSGYFDETKLPLHFVSATCTNMWNSRESDTRLRTLPSTGEPMNLLYWIVWNAKGDNATNHFLIEGLLEIYQSLTTVFSGFRLIRLLLRNLPFPKRKRVEITSSRFSSISN